MNRSCVVSRCGVVHYLVVIGDEVESVVVGGELKGKGAIDDILRSFDSETGADGDHSTWA